MHFISSKQRQQSQKQQQAFLGIVDTGASYTILNTAAANLAGASSRTVCYMITFLYRLSF